MNCPACGLDIDEHPANRCLDAWVAEAVFKRRARYVPPEELPPAAKVDGVPILHKHGVWLLDDYDAKRDGITVSLWDVPASHVPHYSTDIVATWETVQWLLENDHYFTIKPHCFYSPPAWLIYLDTVPEVIGATFPLAISRAALKAVETEHG